jgi:prolyl oligopeptidase
VLFITSTSDDRVHPGHARKMVARMQALGHADVWLLEYQSGGHGAGIEPQSAAERKALCIEFLRSMPGMRAADGIGVGARAG